MVLTSVVLPSPLSNESCCQLVIIGFKSYQKTYQTAGGTGGVNGAKTSWENLNSSDKQTYINEAIGT
mgnify:CR=1 FL=1